VFQLPATATLTDRIRDLYGNELLAQLLPLNGVGSPQIRISGLIGQAGLSRQTRAQQLVFVNGRAIESPLITTAVREGYHTALMKGQYPVTFLFLELDPGAVDVNVHPAKREVRFRDPNGVREAVVAAVRRTLESGRDEWQEQFHAPAAFVVARGVDTCDADVPTQSDSGNREFSDEPEATRPSTTAATFLPDLPNESVGFAPIVQRNEDTTRTASRDQSFQIIGVLNKPYDLMENANGLDLEDQQPAHERMLF